LDASGETLEGDTEPPSVSGGKDLFYYKWNGDGRRLCYPALEGSATHCKEVSMSDQLTVRLPEDLSQALEAASVRLRRKRSDIVRLALYRFFDLESEDSRTPAARVQHLLGALDSGVPDLAENHRAYVLER
jgi:predicted DNA-binding protein